MSSNQGLYDPPVQNSGNERTTELQRVSAIPLRVEGEWGIASLDRDE